MKKIEILLEKYAIHIISIGGIMLFVALAISIIAFCVGLTLAIKLLALSLIIIAIGGLINMLNLFSNIKKQDDFVSLKKQELELLSKKEEERSKQRIREDFDSKEILNTKKILWKFHRDYDNKIGEEFKKLLDIIDKNENEEEVEKASKIDDARWEYVHLFNRNKGILNYLDDFVKDTIDFGEVELLLIIESMEKVKAEHLTNGIFHKELFDAYRERYKEELNEK